MDGELFEIRGRQALADIDEFIKGLKQDGVVIPQSLQDAIEAFREAMQEEPEVQ